MSAILYPVATNAAAALNAPLGRAARASEAVLLAGGPVVFATEATGPAYPTREAALDAFAGRIDDERPGATRTVQPEDRFCDIRELTKAAPLKPGKSQPPAPVYRDGRRWPAPLPPPVTIWRLSISYWRLTDSAAAPVLEHPPELPARRRAGRGGPAADIDALRERLDRPLQPLKPQQPLDIGLFEVRLPEAPHILMPDE